MQTHQSQSQPKKSGDDRMRSDESGEGQKESNENLSADQIDAGGINQPSQTQSTGRGKSQ